jgi:hypothetical protein
MIDASQIILDIAAIGISIYTLTSVHKTDKEAQAHSLFIGNLQGQLYTANVEIKRIESLIPKEVIMPGIEPGVYLPKEGKDSDDAVDYVKSMDLNDWKQIIGTANTNAQAR